MSQNYNDIDNIYTKIDELYYDIEKCKIELQQIITQFSNNISLAVDVMELDSNSKFITEIRKLKKCILDNTTQINSLKRELNPNKPNAIKNKLKTYKALNLKFYTVLIDFVNKEKDKIINELSLLHNEYSRLSKEEKNSWYLRQYESLHISSMYLNLLVTYDMDSIKDIITNDFDFKLYDLITRVWNSVGKVIEFELESNEKGGLDGIVKGDKAKAKLNTIGAGGYNIQAFHYRTLLHIIETY